MSRKTKMTAIFCDLTGVNRAGPRNAMRANGSLNVQAPTVPVYDLTRSDEIFASLDGRFVVIDGTNWQIQIVGIHVDGRWAWVQVVAVGPGQQFSSTFRIDPETPEELLAAVAAWLSPDHAATVARPCSRH